MGESLQKGKAAWKKWAAAREGMSVNDWAGPWLSEMADSGMPGGDFLVQASNVAMNAWLPRPAEYRDFSRAFHTMLMTYGGETPASVVAYTPHGCRHVQITAGTQLAAQGLMTDSALECLGQWEKGSKMPRRYDSEACVTELQTRKTVTNAYRSGWRPATDGSLPTPATPAMGLFALPATPTAMITTQPIALRADGVTSQASASSSSRAVMVFNTRRGKYHLVVPPSMKSKCDFWTCGTATRPTACADFDFNGPGSQCTKCFFR